MSNRYRSFSIRDRVAIGAYSLLRHSALLKTSIGTDFYISAYSLYKAWTDRVELTLIERLVSPTDIVVDVGANIGFYTLKFSELVGPGGLVLAFEPSRWAADILERRVHRKQLRNTRVHRIALADEVGQARLVHGTFPSDDRLDGGGGAPPDWSSEDVATDLLDNVIERSASRPPTLVKIDVQGSEVRVLRGMVRALSQPTRPRILLELWPIGLDAAGSSPGELFKLTADLGLRPSRVVGGGRTVPATPDQLVDACKHGGYVNVLLSPEESP